ncbi:MAG: choice-of-anchor V domain-containing protein [Ignavibacteria bacterium]
MKLNSKNIYIYIFVLFVIGIFAYSFIWYPWGFTGTTRKNQVNSGCICHGDTAASNVTVQIIGPDSVPAGTTAFFRIKTSHGPAIRGGFNVASQYGRLDTIPGWNTQRDTSNNELTHTEPRFFTNDTVSWLFKYTAPANPVMDTLFATSNSTNNDTNNTGDQWNWSPNKNVRVYNPIGIINISTIADKFSISQNYPNPFNPVTTIRFAIPSNVKSQTSNVKLVVFDILGKEVETLVNQQLKPGTYEVEWNGRNYASGIYYYRIQTENFVELKKMIMVK